MSYGCSVLHVHHFHVSCLGKEGMKKDMMKDGMKKEGMMDGKDKEMEGKIM